MTSKPSVERVVGCRCPTRSLWAGRHPGRRLSWRSLATTQWTAPHGRSGCPRAVHRRCGHRTPAACQSGTRSARTSATSVVQNGSGPAMRSPHAVATGTEVTSTRCPSPGRRSSVENGIRIVQPAAMSRSRVVPLTVMTVAGARRSSARSAHLSPCCHSVTGWVMVPSCPQGGTLPESSGRRVRRRSGGPESSGRIFAQPIISK